MTVTGLLKLVVHMHTAPVQLPTSRPLSDLPLMRGTAATSPTCESWTPVSSVVGQRVRQGLDEGSGQAVQLTFPSPFRFAV